MLLEPLLSSLLSPLLTPLIAPVQRVFITANPVLETHFPLENTKTLTGDFSVGALCVLPTAATTVTLFGQLASASNYFKVLSTGFASISIGGSVVTSTVLATKDSKLRIYDVELSGNDFLFQENGVTIDTVTDAGAAANSFVIDVPCQSNGADFYDGTYADPKITDITTPSNSESWKINRAFPATTEQSSSGNNILTYNNAPDSIRGLFTLDQSVTPNRWVGTNLAPPTVNLGSWSESGTTNSIVANEIKFTAMDGTADRAAMSLSGLVIGGIYEVVIRARPGIGSSQFIQQFTWGTIVPTVIDSDRDYNFLVTATATSGLIRVYAASAGFTGDTVFIKSVSVKRIIEVA